MDLEQIFIKNSYHKKTLDLIRFSKRSFLANSKIDCYKSQLEFIIMVLLGHHVFNRMVAGPILILLFIVQILL